MTYHAARGELDSLRAAEFAPGGMSLSEPLIAKTMHAREPSERPARIVQQSGDGLFMSVGGGAPLRERV
jgi:hypothetical protein